MEYIDILIILFQTKKKLKHKKNNFFNLSEKCD